MFDSSGNLSFSTNRYPEWIRGADLTAAGDTLWVVGMAGDWTLDAWNPATGELLIEVELRGFDRCVDLLIDPISPRLYISCFKDDLENPQDTWPSLVVVDRATLEILAILDTYLGDHWPFAARPPFTLVHGGSSGSIHLTAVWDGTSAPVDRGVMVASYDSQ